MIESQVATRRSINSDFTMIRRRRIVVHSLFLLIVGGSLYDIVTRGEHWPFSHYGMFSRVKPSEHLSRLRLYGVLREAWQPELPLSDPKFLQPFDQSRLHSALKKLREAPNGHALLSEATRDCLIRYEGHRATGLHSGPPLQGIRLYEVHWQLDRRASNVDSPEQRTLLLEIVADGS